MLRRARLCHSKLSVCPSICPSVRPSVTFRYRDHTSCNTSKIISRLISLIKVYARADPNVGDLVQWEPPQNKGRIGVGSWEQKPAISLKRCKIGPKLLWRTNRKSHTRFRLVPKSMTFYDLERPWQNLAEKNRFTETARKIWMKTDPYYQR